MQEEDPEEGEEPSKHGTRSMGHPRTLCSLRKRWMVQGCLSS